MGFLFLSPYITYDYYTRWLLDILLGHDEDLLTSPPPPHYHLTKSLRPGQYPDGTIVVLPLKVIQDPPVLW